jgi:prepilin-type N-terminal cleavage/methylation domain-containing protein
METHVKQRGYTILEIAVALTVLSIGSSVLWYSVRASGRAEKINRMHHAAVAAAESELESLRGRARENIKDTAYAVPGPGGEELRVVRQVFDSAKIVASLSEIILDDHMSPEELRKPLEVRVRVFKPKTGEEASPAADGAGFSLDNSSDDVETGNDPPVVSFTVKLPDYQWY